MARAGMLITVYAMLIFRPARAIENRKENGYKVNENLSIGFTDYRLQSISGACQYDKSIKMA